MFPFAAVATLGAGALGFAGQESTNAANAKEAALNREFNAEQAQLNRDFQAGQSATEIQRRVADLKAAGLNPALAYGQGGASSASGSAASGTSARFDSSAGAGLSSAASVGKFVQDAAMQSTQREAVQAQANLTNATADRTRLLQTAELYKLIAEERGLYSSSGLNDLRQRIESDLLPFQIENLRRSAESSTATAAEARERTKGYEPERKFREYQLPFARNMSNMADTWFGKNVVPYLNSAKFLKDLIPFSR